jgi:hypothetical protein
MIPVSIGIAVLRYHLWNIDLIINRTLVYVPLTAILAGMYAGLIAFFQKVFISVSGATSDAAVVLTTLILTASFTPIKNALQSAVDKRFKDAPDSIAKLKALGNELENSLYTVNARNAAKKLLEEAVAAFGVKSGAVYIERDGSLSLAHTVGDWTEGSAYLSVPIEAGDVLLGTLELGERQDRPGYTEKEAQILRKVAAQVANAIA